MSAIGVGGKDVAIARCGVDAGVDGVGVGVTLEFGGVVRFGMVATAAIRWLMDGLLRDLDERVWG